MINLNGTNNDELLTLRVELNSHVKSLHLFEKKTDRLEQAYEYQHEMFDKIEAKVNEIEKLLKEICTNFNKHQGASEIKLRLINYCWAAAGIITTLLFNDFVIKKFWS